MASARRRWISTGARRYRPMAPPASAGYRPELGSETPDIVKRHPLYAVGRHPLLRTPGCVAGSRFGSVRGEAEGAERPEPCRYRPEVGSETQLSTGARGYRPKAPARRPRISTGARRYRPKAPARRPRISTGARRYRPKAPARRPSISTGARGYRPRAPPAGPGYRPESRRYRPDLGIRDARYRPDLPAIDRSWESETPDIDRTPLGPFSEPGAISESVDFELRAITESAGSSLGRYRSGRA